MYVFLTSQLGVSCVCAVIVINVMLGAVAYCIYFERKISAWIQDRYGPNRVGLWGLLQPIADGVKFLMKEDVVPRHADRPLFILAPAMIFVISFIGFAVIPWGGQLALGGHFVDIQVAKPDIGLLYILSVSAMSVYGVVLGGWASNNKYSFYGAIRATAQMLSYEIPMGLVILVVVMMMGTLRLEQMTLGQAQYWAGWIPQWNVFLHPLAFGILFVTALAEANRAPFDLAESEQELVGGFHTEYSALKFGMFFLGEYAHMITGSAFIAVLFLGGWHLPWLAWTQPEATHLWAVIAKVLVLCGKICALLFVMMWIRWTLPRFRFDQLMRLAWKGLIPISLALVTLQTAMVFVGQPRSAALALGGNAAILLAALVFQAIFGTRITGRQRNLAGVGGEGVALGAMYTEANV